MGFEARIERTIIVSLSTYECLHVTAQLVRENPEIVSTILRNGGKVNCPFPESCSSFPCSTLSCDADTCLNGYAFRQS